ncbi:hypothetical protein [Pseudomonas kurunegalensis]|uniref:hypothetical protein n=1 Tax=Pseudomonas kurunegalensis TaxID=485880 RepID=UPI004027F037
MKPLKVLAIGVLLAVGIMATGYFLQQRQLAKVDVLVAQCKGEHLNRPDGPWKKWQQDPLVCDPAELVLLPNKVAIQKEISHARYEAYDTASTASWIAGMVVVLSALPFLWQFLLNRIRELANAIRGKE